MVSKPCCTSVAWALLLFTVVAARPPYQLQIPNGKNVVRNGLAWPGVGHYAVGGGGTRNPFGLDFSDMGHAWSITLCQADSDGDGFANGVELGDPNCVWTPGATPSRTVNITHPGFADSYPAIATTKSPASPQGPTTTTPTPPKRTPSPPLVTAEYDTVGPLIAQSSANVSVLANAAQLQWRVYLATNNGSDIVEFVMTSSRLGQWLGVGVAAVGMNGPVLVCNVNTAGAAPTSVCRTGRGLSFSATFDTFVQADLVGFNVSASSWTVTVRIAASVFGIVDAGPQRFIIAHGDFDVASNVPLQHGGDTTDRDTVAIDIYAGTSRSTDQSKWTTLATEVVVAVCVLWLMITAASNAAGIVLRPTSHAAARFTLSVVFCGMTAFYMWSAYQDATLNLKSSPVGRAMGKGAVFCFWFVMYPVPKHFGLATVAGTSFERIIAYHEQVGTLLCIFATVHMAMMIDVTPYASDVVFRWQGVQPYLAGMIAWMCLVVVVVTGWLLKSLLYWMFRAAHLLAIPAIVFGILHHPPLGYALIPPMLNVVSDWVARYVKHRRAQATIHSAKALGIGTFTHLAIGLRSHTPWPDPGAFALLGIPGIGCSALPHPLTIAWFDEAASEAHVIIRNMGPETWSEAITDEFTIDDRPPMVGRRVVWLGPFGRLAVPLGHTPHVALVAGGIGITACLSVLQHATMRDEYRVKMTHVMLLWTLREPELCEAVLPFVARCRSAAAAVNLTVAVKVFLTAHRAVYALTDLQKRFPFVTFFKRRVRIEDDVNVCLIESQLTVEVPVPSSPHDSEEPMTPPKPPQANAPSTDGTPAGFCGSSSSFPMPLSLFCCGPNGLSVACRSYASSRDHTYLHIEAFEYGAIR